MSTRRTILAAILAVVGLASEASAQYFGRNKVQYQKFDFRVLSTEHFDVYYYPEEEATVELAAFMAERWYTRLSKLLSHQLSGRQPLILYAAHAHFEQTNTLPGEIGEGTGGVTEMLKRRVVLPFAGGLAETDHVLGHELVHAFQFDMASRRDVEGNPVGPAVVNLPLWFIEGMTEYLSLGPIDSHTAMWVREAASRDGMPRVEDLDHPDFFPYRYGHAFWAYVGGRRGDEIIGDVLRATGREGDIRGAMRSVLGVDEDTFTRDWHDATQRTYAPFFETTRRASTFARPLVTREGSRGELNVAPSLSPDGRRVAYLNRTHRWNWGVIGDQTPYVTGSFGRGIANVGGQTVFVEQTHRIVQINRGASGVLQYPFSRAARVEFTGGFRQIAFDQDLRTQFFSTTTGAFIDETVEELARPNALNLGETSAALVYDSSVFGATGPTVGQRARFEYSQSAALSCAFRSSASSAGAPFTGLCPSSSPSLATPASPGRAISSRRSLAATVIG